MKQPTVIILYGPIAVGKLTIGKMLAEKTGFKLSHNHLINDLIDSVFERTSQYNSDLKEKYRFNFYNDLAECGINFIITHAFSYNFVSKSGLSDPDYLIKLKENFESKGYRVFLIHLQAESELLLNRVEQESRAQHGKLLDKEIMKELISKKDWKSTVDIEGNVVIENNDPEETVEKILNLINL